MNNFNYRSFIHILSYIAVILVGASLLIQAFLKGNEVATILKIVADSIAYLMLAVVSFSYAKSRRNVIFVIIWIVAVVMIVASYII